MAFFYGDMYLFLNVVVCLNGLFLFSENSAKLCTVCFHIVHLSGGKFNKQHIVGLGV